MKIFLCLIFLLFYHCLSSASEALNECGRSEKQKSELPNCIKEISGQCKTYKVKKGDTLYRISKKAGVPVKELKRLNRINKNIIKSGQILIISKQEDKSPGLSRDLQLEEPVQQPEDKITVEEQVSESENSTSHERGKLVQFALSFLNTPYRKGGTTLRGIDCSGLVWSVFMNAGIEIPRTVRELFSSGKPIEREEILPGDLIFFYTRKSSEPDHVGIYIGEDKFIHASRRARRVIIAELDSPYFFKRFAGVRRFFE